MNPKNTSGKQASKRKVDDRTISQMRNLGPTCERDLNAAGITTAKQLIEVGVEAAFIKMLSARKATGRSAKCCNAAYLYALHGAIHDCDWRELPEKTKLKYKQLSAELRASGMFE
jgi:DNA transformation protein and related proteins